MRIPRITIDMMVAVVTLAQKRTMVGAAKALGISPSAVQKRIHAVNRVLSRPLFMRIDNGMALTQAGERFYPDAVKALEETLLAEDKALSLLELESGRLLVGHSTYLPPRVLTAILKLRLDDSPGIQIEHIPLLTSTAVQRVADGTIHAGLGFLPVTEPDLISYVLFEEPVVVCMPSTHPLAAKPWIRPQDIDGEPVIAVAREILPGMHREIEEFFAGFGVSLGIVADAFASPEAVTMVEHKMGLCMVAASAVSRPSVVGRPLTPRTLIRKCGLFVREENRHPTLKAFVDKILHEMSGLR
ncbi:MAG: LysR family transcriptional regulator [Terracidiphilus sp.]|jgi:DNA-binding transcriptional LysR family regulator